METGNRPHTNGQRSPPEAAEAAEISRLGQQIYDQQLRGQLEPGHNGEFAVIDVDTGDYEVDAESVAASDKAVRRRPGGRFYMVRIGTPSAFRLGRAAGSAP